MHRRRLLTSAAASPLLGLPGCAVMTTIGVASGVLTPSGAVSLYGICKGVAEIALIADPGLATIVNVALAVAGPLLADIQRGGPNAQASANALIAQSSALLVQTAQVVTVKPNATA